MAELKIKADTGAGTVSLKGPNATTDNAAVQLTLPVDDGAANQYLKTDGSGALSWAKVAGTSIAMGSDAAGDILYHNGTDYIRLPKGDNGQVLTLTGGVPTWENASGGITEADNWRITSDVTTNTDPLTNWERVDDPGFSKIGTGLSHSSGIFSFPSTGIWYINHTLRGYVTEDTAMNMQLYLTLNNGTAWDDVAMATVGFNASSGEAGTGSGSASYLFDVTDTSNCKIKFDVGSVAGSSKAYGDSAVSETHFQVIRLGDT